MMSQSRSANDVIRPASRAINASAPFRFTLDRTGNDAASFFLRCFQDKSFETNKEPDIHGLAAQAWIRQDLARILIQFPLATESSVVNFADRLAAAVKKTRSVACVGLDPRTDQLPSSLREQAAAGGSLDAVANAYEQFCFGIIDVVRDLVPVVKPQAAFFEQLGPTGMVSLGRVVKYASAAGLVVIMDAKRNDIGSTAAGYAEAYLGAGGKSPWGSDSLTVSPYLGRDSIEPFVDVCDQRGAGIFVLVKTSNPGGGMLQDRKTDGETVYQAVASLVTELNRPRIGTSGFGPIGAVVGATYPEQLSEMRAAMPHSWILVPGYGAQGGSAADVLGAFNSHGLGGIVNSSRNIIFAHQRAEFRESCGDAKWQQAVELATRQMNEELNVIS